MDVVVIGAGPAGVVAAFRAAELGARTTLVARDHFGGFTDPEYAQVGLTETRARADHNIVVATARFAELPRPIIDGRTVGFCKLIADRESHRILGCHIVGERAVELAQVAAVAMASGATVGVLAGLPLSFPTYANVLGRAAIGAAHQLGAPGVWDAAELAMAPERGRGGRHA